MKMTTKYYMVSFRFDLWDTILNQEIEVKKGKNPTKEFEKWIKRHTTEFGVNAGSKFTIVESRFIGICN